jgi:hypothetical protein
MDIVSWFLWLLWQSFYIIFWTWPLWYVSWLAVAVMLVSARTEYYKSGGGIKGLLHAVWFAVVNLPRTMNAILRWFAMQIVMLASIVTKTDVMSQLPNFVRRWLGHSPTETRTVYRDKIVERIKWKRPPLLWRLVKTTLLVFLGIVLTRAYDYGYLGPWTRGAAAWFYNLF